MNKFALFLKIFSVISAVSEWSQKAFADGKIDVKEAAELVAAIALALDIKTQIDLD